MKLLFRYDVKKDIENYKKASHSMNNKKPTNIQARYIAEYGEAFNDQNLNIFIKKLITEKKLHLLRETERIEAAWRIVEKNFVKRAERIFQVTSPVKNIQVYLTTDTRCSYNTKEGYFFVSVSRSFQNLTIMHELLHFWTWWTFHQEVEQGHVTTECYNDVKESLTELLNIEFHDLLDGAHDDGYPQHQKMRAIVGDVWDKTTDIKKVFEEIVKQCPVDKKNATL